MARVASRGFLLALFCAAWLPVTTAQGQSQLPADEAAEIAGDAYLYGYPLALMELTRRVQVGRPDETAMNRFRHLRASPDASFTDVVRPNADTLYSTMWFDVSNEPLIVEVPLARGRYHLLQIMDMWTDAFATPGSRTFGNEGYKFALVAPDWQGQLPKQVTLIRCPTPIGWIIGRTQANGKADLPNVHAFQDGIRVAPLSKLGADGAVPASYLAPKTPGDPNWDVKTPPVEQLARLSGVDFFQLVAELLKTHPPHANDYPMLQRMARLGIVAGQTLNASKLSDPVRATLDTTPVAGQKIIQNGLLKQGTLHNGWRITLSPIGTYGADYRTRACVAFGGLGANSACDAVYPMAFTDAAGEPLASDRRYKMHFPASQTPPVRAFWSLTMYNDRQLFAANSLNRYAIGDRDPLKFNDDGSLDLYIQRESPGSDKEANWLPAPGEGTFTLTMRLYWPKPAVLAGDWSPPAVEHLP